MNTLRIFISSPSDVREERTVAGRVIERLQGKYWSFVRLDDVFWESRVARATAHFQDELLNPGQCDMVLGILWTRLGSPLPEKFRKLTGEAHATGTEWELSQAFEAYDANLAQTGDPLIAKPDVIVYRRTEERAGDPSDGEDRRQREALTAFIEREFFNQDAHHTIKRALTSYATLEEFETRLAGDLEQLILRRIPTLKPGFEPPPISGPPFKDLSHFDFEDSDRFFGRNRAIREVQQRLIERATEGMPFVLIYGGSGYGKSSLMRAGLAPVLTRPGGALEGMDRWRRVLVQPGKGTGPLCERLARVLLAPPTPHDLDQQKVHEQWPLPGLPELAQTTIDPDDTGECWDAASLARLLADETKLLYAAAGVARTLDRIGCSLLLQIDQLEEGFTSESVTAAEHNAFCRAVAALTRTRRVWTVATMRSEYFPRIAETPALAALVGKSGGYILAPPTPQELREIVRFPALAARLDYERATSPREIAGTLTTAEHLDEQILADAADSPDALPLIEFTLHKLHAALLAPDGRRTGDILHWDTYAALGGLKGAIARTAEDTFATLAPSAQSACAALFANLVRVGYGARDIVTRRRTPLVALGTAAPGAGDFLGAFLAARLLVTDEASGQPVVTLAHEALLTHWPRLAEWIARHRAILRSRQRLEENTRVWVDAARSKKLLLSEGRLAEAEEVERSRLFQLGDDESTLIAQSRRQAKRRLRTFQVAASLFAILAALASFAGVMAWEQRGAAEKRRIEAEAARGKEASARALAETQRSEAEAARLREAATNEQRRKSLVEASWAAFNQAQRLFDEADYADPSKPDGILIRRSKSQEALLHLARAVKFNPQNRTARDAFGWNVVTRRASLRLIPHSVLQHEEGVNYAAFSPDGDRIVTTSWDGSAKIWDATTGQAIANLPHEDIVYHAAFSPDGKRVATASGNLGNSGVAKIWDTVTGRELAVLRHDDMVDLARFSPSGEQVLTAGADTTARLWEAGTGRLLATLRHERELSNANFSASGTRVITASYDKTAKLWETMTGKLQATLREADVVMDADFSPDETKAITVAGDHAKVWNATTGKDLATLKGSEKIQNATFSPDGLRVITLGIEPPNVGVARIWDISTGKMLATLQHRIHIRHASFSRDGARVVTASDDGTAKVWKTTGALLATLHHGGEIWHADFSPDGARVVTASMDKTAKVWEVATGHGHVALHHDDGIGETNFSPDGTRLVTASRDETAKLWDAATGKTLATLSHDDDVNGASFSADGTRVVTMSNDHSAKIWTAATGKLTATLPHNDLVYSVRFTPNGSRVISASVDNTVKAWEVATGKELMTIQNAGKARFNSQGTRVITMNEDQTAKVLDLATGKLLATFQQEGSFPYASISPDGARAATKSNETTAKLWEAATGKMLARLQHDGAVNEVSFSPDSTRAVTVSADKTAKLWEAATGKLLFTLPHGGAVDEAHFSPTGARLVTASDDHFAMVWDLATGRLIAALPHDREVNCASFSPDETRIVTGTGGVNQSGVGKVWDAETGKALVTLHHERAVYNVAFSSDGTRLVTGTLGETVRVWDVATGIALAASNAPADDYETLAEVLSGHELTENGDLRALDETVPSAAHQRLLKLATASSAEGKVARWIGATGPEALTTPLSTTSLRDRVEVLLTNGADADLHEAYETWSTHPLIQIALAAVRLRPQGVRQSDAEYQAAQRVAKARTTFLRDYGMKRLHADPELWGRAATMLGDQEDYQRALEAADRALALNPKTLSALRARARALGELKKNDDALAAYRTLLAAGGSQLEDFTEPSYLAATMNRKADAESLLGAAREKFPDSDSLERMEGWIRINLGQAPAAVSAFRKCESLLAPGGKLSANPLTGLALALWLDGQQDVAVDTYRKLIEISPAWAKAATITEAECTPAELPLEALRARTLTRHPELQPKEESRPKVLPPSVSQGLKVYQGEPKSKQ